MKYVITFVIALGLLACNKESESDKPTYTPPSTTTQTQSINPNPGTESRRITINPDGSVSDPNVKTDNNTANGGSTFAPADQAGVVHHYICPDKCEGGYGDARGNCPICSKPMDHNQAWHAQQAPAPGTPITAGNTGAGGTDNINVTMADGSSLAGGNQNPSEPAQNAKGIWHYICNNGCSGGGGGATACASCGTKLVHNAAYHQ